MRTTALVCPCHDVTEADLHQIIDEGHTSAETIKRATAVYMGACQGKYCAVLVQQLLQERGIDTSKRPAARAPLYPVALGALADPETS